MVFEGKEEKLLNGSFKYKKFGNQVYIFDRVIFRLTFVAVLIVFFFVAIDSGGFKNHFFYSCPEGAGSCQNIFWENCSREAFYSCADINLIPVEYRYLGKEEFIIAGTELGRRPGFLVNYFGLLFFLLLLSAFLFNHFTYNKGFSFKNLKGEINK